MTGGTPSVVAFESQAVVNDEWACTWTTRPPAYPWTYPDVPTVLAIGLIPMAPVQIPGGGGCWFMARFDALMIPGAGPKVTQGQGVVRTRITFPDEALGWTFHIQLIAADSRTPIGVVTSPLLTATPQNAS